MSPRATSGAAVVGGERAAPDRAAAVRTAVRSLVAERGFHGASMSAVAERASVGTGTAYVHYASKDELVIAAYVETKARLGEAALAEVAAEDPPDERFRKLWLGTFRHFADNPGEARFLIQVEGSPYAEAAHAAAMERDDDALVLAAAAPDMAERLLPLAPEVLYELGISPAVRLAARVIELPAEELSGIAEACWRAVSRPDRA